MGGFVKLCLCLGETVPVGGSVRVHMEGVQDLLAVRFVINVDTCRRFSCSRDIQHYRASWPSS